jgi:CheY-like chemotaxis protein
MVKIVKVLVVDDDVDHLVLMKDILPLKFPAIIIETAENGIDALDILESANDKPRIVFIDIRRPMDSAELCKIVKNKYKGIMVAQMEAFNETSGCFDEIFFKPIDFDALFNYIKVHWN